MESRGKFGTPKLDTSNQIPVDDVTNTFTSLMIMGGQGHELAAAGEEGPGAKEIWSSGAWE